MGEIMAQVTGTGCICGAGKSLPEVMDTLYSGNRNCSPPALITSELDKPYPVFEVDSAWINLPVPKWRKKTTRTVQLALTAIQEALTQAELEISALKKKRVGVCLGTTVGCTLNNEPFYRKFREGYCPGPEAPKRYLANNPAKFAAKALKLSGPVLSVVNACSSGADAIGIAGSWIRSGLCDIAIAGGADELSRITYLGFISLMISSEEPCRPFDVNRAGLNLGEGAGIVILESPESVASRGVKPLADLCGYGNAADAFHPTRPHPEGRGLRSAISQALSQAGITPGQVGFVNAHGTSTPENDKAEGNVITSVLGTKIPVYAPKSYFGHTLGAAGGIEAALTVKALQDGRIPATAGFSGPDPECGVSPVRENTDIKVDYGISNSLAFGGNNTALLFGRALS